MKTAKSRCRSSLTAQMLLLAAVIASPLSAQTGGVLGDWTVDTFRWTQTADTVEIADTTEVVEVHNPYGNIRLRKAEHGQVFASAAIQRHQDDPRLANIRVDETEGKVTIEVAFHTPDDFDSAVLTEEMAKRRIDISVLIPAGARLIVQTGDGEIEAKGLESDVSATSSHGDIVVAIAGSLEARSQRGAIKAVLKTADWRTPPMIVTTTGEIVVWLPPDADTTVRARTAGWITTDYSLEITSPPSAVTKSAVAKIGEGKHPFSIDSTKGNIRLSRLRSLPQE